MDIFFQLFWLFFILSSLSPYFNQQMLLAARARRITDLERKRKSRVITLIHRQEGFPFWGFRLRATSISTIRSRSCGPSV